MSDAASAASVSISAATVDDRPAGSQSAATIAGGQHGRADEHRGAGRVDVQVGAAARRPRSTKIAVMTAVPRAMPISRTVELTPDALAWSTHAEGRQQGRRRRGEHEAHADAGHDERHDELRRTSRSVDSVSAIQNSATACSSEAGDHEHARADARRDEAGERGDEHRRERPRRGLHRRLERRRALHDLHVLDQDEHRAERAEAEARSRRCSSTENERSRNSRSGTSGAFARACQSTNATSSTAPSRRSRRSRRGCPAVVVAAHDRVDQTEHADARRARRRRRRCARAAPKSLGSTKQASGIAMMRDGHVDPEDRLPAPALHDRAADERARPRRRGRRCRPRCRSRAGAARRRRRPRERERQRQHARGAEALQGPRGDELAGVGAERRERPSRSPKIAMPIMNTVRRPKRSPSAAATRIMLANDERVGVHEPLQLLDRGAEVDRGARGARWS